MDLANDGPAFKFSFYFACENIIEIMLTHSLDFWLNSTT